MRVLAWVLRSWRVGCLVGRLDHEMGIDTEIVRRTLDHIVRGQRYWSIIYHQSKSSVFAISLSNPSNTLPRPLLTTPNIVLPFTLL